jgi:uncharacterized membrane protein YhaH (DUF805 family)
VFCGLVVSQTLLEVCILVQNAIFCGYTKSHCIQIAQRLLTFISKLVLINTFCYEGFEKAFRYNIVPAIALSAHTPVD